MVKGKKTRCEFTASASGSRLAPSRDRSYIILWGGDAVDESVSVMSQNDNHGHNCGDHAHADDHAHSNTGSNGDNLYAHIDRSNVVALNSIHGGSEVIKPWDERMDEQVVGLSFFPKKSVCLASFRRVLVHRVGRG